MSTNTIGRSTQRPGKPPEPNQAARPLTTQETAELLGVSAGTLGQWRFNGKGPRFLKLGHAVRYEPEEIERFKRRNTRQSTAER